MSKKKSKPDLIGIIILKLNDIFGSKKPISDEEIDSVISSIRAKHGTTVETDNRH